MAITLAENFRMVAGGRKMMFITVTHDESDMEFTAASVALDYIEHIQMGFPYTASEAANLSTFAMAGHCSINATHDTVAYLNVPKTGSTQNLIIVGW